MDENIKDTTNATQETTVDTTASEQTSTSEADVQAALANALADAKRFKAALDKKSSAYAALDKKYQAKLSEEERASIEKAQEEAEHKEYVAGLERFKAVTELADQFVDLGYSKEMARKAAEAQFDGDRAEVLRIQKDYQAELEKKIKSTLMKSMPAPTIGNDDSVQMTQEQFDAMTYSEQLKLYREHPAVYAKFTN